MAPSVRTEQRRLQRASQRQRARTQVGDDGLCMDALGQEGMPQANGTCEGLSTEAFAAAMCHLVDVYRSSGAKSLLPFELPQTPNSTSPCNNAAPTLLMQRYGADDPPKAHTKVMESPDVPDEVPAIAGPPGVYDLPPSPTARPYIVRNTFIDVALTPRDVAQCEAVFNTWPGANQVSTEDARFCDMQNATPCAPLPRPISDEQAQAAEDGEMNNDADEEGALSDEQERADECAIQGNWEPMTEQWVDAVKPLMPAQHFSMFTPRPEDSAPPDGSSLDIPWEGTLENHTVTLENLLRQTLDGHQGGPWKVGQPEVQSPQKGWWMNRGEGTGREPHTDDSTVSRCDSSLNASGSTSPNVAREILEISPR